MFDKQIEVIAAPGKRKVQLCGARSGKTEGSLRYAAKVCRRKRRAQVCFIGITRTSAKNSAWEVFRRLNTENGWGFKLTESELRARAPNGSWLLFCGSDSKRELEKFRGVPWDLVIIDECGSHRPDYLKYLIISVIEPRLMDRNGELWLLGTPTAQRWGIFYDITTGSDTTGKKYNGWSVHHWTARENPHINWDRFVNDPETGVLALNGWTTDSAIFRREYLGEWVVEITDLAYRFLRERNVVAELPQLQRGDRWRFIMAIDFGFVHATAYVVVAESERYGRNCYVVEAAQRVALAPTEAADWLKSVIARYKPDVLVGDLGGAGKPYAAEMATRHDIPIKMAKKEDKRAALEVASDMLHTGQALCIESMSHTLPSGEVLVTSTRDLQAQLAVLQRDPKTGDIAKGQPDDVADAFKYAMRETLCYSNRQTSSTAPAAPAHALDEDELDEDDQPRQRHYLEVDDGV
ncbi:MAG TPA: hypothetical protein VK509_14760 [Polyangiales bacterium]|nr:hypothetical protein [Polyangiales bacterium]